MRNTSFQLEVCRQREGASFTTHGWNGVRRAARQGNLQQGGGNEPVEVVQSELPR